MKITVKHWLTATKYEWNDEWLYSLKDYVASSEISRQSIVLREMDIELDIPDDFDPREQQIAALEKQRQKAMADHQMLMDTIEGKIQSLRCIEHKEEA